MRTFLASAMVSLRFLVERLIGKSNGCTDRAMEWQRSVEVPFCFSLFKEKFYNQECRMKRKMKSLRNWGDLPMCEMSIWWWFNLSMLIDAKQPYDIRGQI